MTFAKRVYLFAGIWGLLVIIPGFFNEAAIAKQQPPALNHVEYFYGFYTVALAFQVLFLLISRDPVRHRALMPACMLEKFGYIAAMGILLALGRIPHLIGIFAALDLIWGVLFIAAYRKTAPSAIA